MVNYIVFPDLYQGSALLDIVNEIKEEVKKYKIKVKFVKFSGKLKKIKSGDLDDPEIFFSHNIHIMKELRRVLKNKDKVLFIDFFQPCLSLLKYYLDSTSKRIKFGSLFHGASFVEGDFFEGNEWMRNFDLGIIEIMDTIYVPSKYIAKQFDEIGYKKKIKVLPFGFNPYKFKCNLEKDKLYDVIIPHRWSWDRDPVLVKELIVNSPNIKFAISGYGKYSKDVKLRNIFMTLIKKDNVINLGVRSGKIHYTDLAKSKIVIAMKDSFGYSIRKAIACGCVPLVKKGSSYAEFLDKENQFEDVKEVKLKIEDFLRNYPKDYKKIKKTEFRKILEDFFNND